MALREADRLSVQETTSRPARGSVKADPVQGRRPGQQVGGPAGGGRQARGPGAISSQPLVRPLHLGDITIDGAQLMVERNGYCSWFTPAEWRLLCVFLRDPGAVLSREELAEQAWGRTDEEHSGTVDVYIWRLRRKLDVGPARSRGRQRPQLIQTVRHQGYRLVVDGREGEVADESEGRASGSAARRSRRHTAG